MPTLKAIHIAKSLKANRTSQNLPISMSLPTLKEKLIKFKIINEIIKHESTTLCISNGWQGADNETYMNKINGSAIMKISANNPATTHTLDRYLQP